MLSGRRNPDIRPLLFDRLLADSPATGQVASSESARDEQGLSASIARELTALLNTRAPLPIDALEGRGRSTIDYGIPDLSAFPVGEHTAMERLVRHLRDAIAAYEPRLENPVVELAPRGGLENATVIVRGAARAGNTSTPVAFELALFASGVDGG